MARLISIYAQLLTEVELRESRLRELPAGPISLLLDNGPEALLWDLAALFGRSNHARLLEERNVISSSYSSCLNLAQAKILIRRDDSALAIPLLNNIIESHSTGERVQPLCTMELVLECEGILAEVESTDYLQSSDRIQAVVEKALSHGFLTAAVDHIFRHALLAHQAGRIETARSWPTRGLEASKPIKYRLPMEHLERTYPELCALVERDNQNELLSEREIEVLRLVEECLSNAEIGKRLFISVFTVKSHIQRICGKLGVRRRGQAVAKAKSLGIF